MKQNQNESNEDCKSGWTDDDKRKLASVAFPLIEMQKQYGRKMDSKIVMKGWQVKLEGRYSVEQVLYALHQYTDINDDFPTPANLIAILEPEAPRVSHSAYVQACKTIEASGYYDPYSDAAAIKKRYERQNQEEFEHAETNKRRLRELASGKAGVNSLGDNLKKMQIMQKCD